MQTGLVLEGGGIRGIFSAGVLDELMENDCKFSACVGVSAGACFGCNYVSEQKGRALRYNLKYCKDDRYCSVASLIKTGDMFNAHFCYETIPFELDVFDSDTFAKSETEFYVVCMDVRSGQSVYKKLEKGDAKDLQWIRASASLPMVSRVVNVDGLELLDGGMTDSIPLEYMENIGYKKNVVVLTKERAYVRKKNPLMPMIRIKMRNYPKVVEAMANRHVMYNSEREHIFLQEKAGNAFVICPEMPLDCGRIEHDSEKIRKTYDHGREVARKRLADLKEFMKM